MKKENLFAIGSPVEDFVESLVKQAKTGLKKQGFVTCPENEKHLMIEMNATVEKEGNAGVTVKILNFGGKISDQQMQKVTIFAKEESESDKEIEEAKIAEAKQRKNYAKNFSKPLK